MKVNSNFLIFFKKIENFNDTKSLILLMITINNFIFI